MKSDCKLVTLPVKRDSRGALAFSEIGKHLAFEVRREFHLFDLKAGTARGGHAHKLCQQFLIAMAGEFRVVINNGQVSQTWNLISPEQGLYVPACNWLDLVSLTDSAVLLVLTSHTYDELDYIRNWEDFIRYVYTSQF